MATDNTRIATLEGQIIKNGIVFKDDSRGKRFVTVSIQQEGLEFPTNVRARDPGLLERMDNAKKQLDNGVSVYLGVEVKESPTPSGTGYYRDILRITKASIGDVPQEPDIEDSRPAPAKAQTARPPSVDENQMRIMRQSTLGYAATVIAPVVKDFATPQRMVNATIQIGQMFMLYVLTGENPSYEDAPEQPVETQEPDVDLPADPLDGEAPPPSDLDEPAPEVFEV